MFSGSRMVIIAFGCAIARSEEAKALHIKMGDPLFKIRDVIKRHGIEVRSSNYELYADMNRRFNAVIAEHSDLIEVYSIDESFYRLPVLANGLGDVAAAHKLRAAIARTTGLPTRIGLGPTRALSKVANALAKATEKIWDGVVDLHDTELRARLFAEWPVKEVWGIGSALAARLLPLCVPADNSVRHDESGAAALPRRWSLFPERLELASPLARGPGCRCGHPVCCDLRLDCCQIREPCLGACGLNVHMNLRLFV